jgi:hypothetical protein
VLELQKPEAIRKEGVPRHMCACAQPLSNMWIIRHSCAMLNIHQAMLSLPATCCATHAPLLGLCLPAHPLAISHPSNHAGPGPCRLFGEANRFLLGDTYHEPHKLYVWDLYRSEVTIVI